MTKYELGVVCGISFEFACEGTDVEIVYDEALLSVQKQLELLQGVARLFITDFTLTFNGVQLMNMNKRFSSLLSPPTAEAKEEVLRD